MPSKRLLLAEDSSEFCNEFFVGQYREDNSSILEHMCPIGCLPAPSMLLKEMVMLLAVET